MSHKVLLQFLIGVVDAQLLQIIDVETLKPVHVQDSWRSRGGGGGSCVSSWKEPEAMHLNDPTNNHAFTYEVAPRGFVCTYALVDECNQPFK